MSLDDRIRAAARELDGSTDLAASVSAYWRVEERYRAEMATAGSAATLHRRAVGIDAYLRGEEAARDGRTADAKALFAVAARCGIGDPADLDHEADKDPLDAVIEAARAGGRLALEIVLQEVRPFVRALCTSVGSGPEPAEGRAHTICLAVVAALPEYDPQIPFLEFVHGVVLRLLGTGGTSSRDLASTAGLREALIRRMLHQLPGKQRDVLVLRFLLGLSPEQTARILGATPGAVRVAEHRALARIRAGLGRSPEDELTRIRPSRLDPRRGVNRGDPEEADVRPNRPSLGWPREW
jgi:RNA polymerase sigma-70 factor, ECF subfamily